MAPLTTAEFRDHLARFLESRSRRAQELRNRADDILVRSIELLDSAARLRGREDPAFADIADSIESLVRRGEVLELEFRDQAKVEAEECVALAQEGHLVARQSDIIDTIIALVTRAETEGREAEADPEIARLENVRRILEIELRRVEELHPKT